MLHSIFIISSLMFYCSASVVTLHVDIIPPAKFLVDIAVNYIKIPDVVLSVLDNTNVPVQTYAQLLYNHNVFTSVYVWTNEGNIQEQFESFVSVLSSGKQRTIVFFLDDSSKIFLQLAHLVRIHLFLPCFYKWVFFDTAEFDVTKLEHFNTSAVCWETIYVRKKNYTESEDVRLSLLGPGLLKDGNCILKLQLGEWSSSDGLTHTLPFQKRIKDFRGRTFAASFLNEQPFFARTEDGKGYEGLEFELLKTLMKRLNFKVRQIENSDGEFGKQLPNGSWTGFLGLIASGKAIFSIGTLSISNRRMKAVDFSAPYLFGKLAFVIISPALESRHFVLIKPLQPKVWSALMGTLVICTIVLYLITHLLPCKSGVRRSYNIWFLLRTLGQQGTPSPAPGRYSIRFFISGWWFFIMVILWSYAGTLTSFMTYPGTRPTIDTTDMAKVNPIFAQSLRENPEGLVYSVPEGMKLVLEGKFAFVYMKAILKWFAATLGYDQFRFSKNVFNTDTIGIAMQKCHPCKKSFDGVVDRLEETGFFSKWYDDAFFKASLKAPNVVINAVQALSVDDMQGAFFFLGMGLIISAMVLCSEIMLWSMFGKKGKRRRKRTRKKLK